ncbi:hypothetical protein A3Q56_03411 [Intoshia linei]|uniref:Uncharacterized protein n=1 Tax=Intoshia linei TaxID=1819745 RepID=A0A177B599_9BILA|nr:hypothetical protein A3Q56_03411 [Intoshia linei]
MSTSIRSSVRPRSSKQPWGTIIHPIYGLGYQRMTKYEVDQITDRLYCLSKRKTQRVAEISTINKKSLNKIQINRMINRLTLNSRAKSADSRRLNFPFYKKMGIVGTYAWRGYR